MKKGFEFVKRNMVGFVKEEDGVGVVEIILILAILVFLVSLFKEEVESLVTTAIDSVSDRGDEVLEFDR